MFKPAAAQVLSLYPVLAFLFPHEVRAGLRPFPCANCLLLLSEVLDALT